MDLFKIFKSPQNTRICVLCDRRVPADYSHIKSNELCICNTCYETIDKFSSVVFFAGNKYMKFGISVYPYSGNLREMFSKYKFKGYWKYSEIFGLMLIESLDAIINREDFDLAIPVPLSSRRMKERGYNQTKLMFEDFLNHKNIEISENSLFRIRNTKRQSSLSSTDRMKNISNAFLADKRFVCGKRILLIDDIFTRGNTLYECAKTLSNAGAKEITGLTFFKTNLTINETYTFEPPFKN